ncbi:MAG: TRAP transporter permease [Betaproteobacteria bacterium]|nr:TRAP transporter permease [Betaproteobacteria bacterium]
MSNNKITSSPSAPDAPAPEGQALIEKVIAAESGARAPEGFTRQLIVYLAVAWSLFQLWISSPVPFWVSAAVPALQKFVMFNDTMARSIHLSFAIFLVYLAYPMWKKSPRSYVPAYDWLFAFAAAFCTSYLFVFHAELSTRQGSPTTLDIGVACVGVVMLLEATRRCLGKPMMIMGIVFLVYMFAGQYMPDMIAHKGASLSRAASHQWITTEGVFGVALGVSTSFVFLYVLFGAMLDKAGAGNYLTRVAFALMGHMRGGPAKAAVLSSGLNGMISGSSVANVLTGGNVTIMLMKRVGYSAVKAGAIEVSSSSNGQIMPPVMGAAAFLMVEYVNIPYSEIVKHAFLPAILAYLSLLYIVHLEACKAGMVGLPRRISPLKGRLLGWAGAIAGTLIIVKVSLALTEWIPAVFGEASSLVVGAMIAIIYVGLVWYSVRWPDNVTDELDPDSMTELPATMPTLLAGLFYILPLFILVWCLMVMEQSPGLAAFYACTFMALMLVTQRPMIAFFRKRSLAGAARHGFLDFYQSLELGGRNMIGIAIATSVAGIIVGTVSLTGIGQVLANVVEELSFGSLMVVLLLTALLSLILGMGLPTTANYIVVATLLAPVIVSLAASHGLEVPLIAVHLFVFYFGIMADATPPVALAAYAAAGLSGADPLETGIQGFIYEIRTAILPFMFIFNTELLMIGITSWPHFVWVVVTAITACFVFAAVTQGFFLTRNRAWEAVALVLVTFSLFRPDIYRDWFYAPYRVAPLSQLQAEISKLKPDQNMRLRIEVEEKDKTGKVEIEQRTFVLPVTKGSDEGRLKRVGLELDTAPRDGKLEIVDIGVDSKAERARLDIGNKNRLLGIEVRNPQPDKEWFALPAFLLLGLVIFSQRRRIVREGAAN